VRASVGEEEKMVRPERRILPQLDSESRERKAASLKEVVKDVLTSLENSDLRKCGKIFLRWPEIVGGALAQHTRPEHVRGKKLKVGVDSSNWLYEINRNLEKSILEKVQEWVGKDTIQEISYYVGDSVHRDS
jgi:predicted nucleic acid-binding Zn ribbon protein